MRKNPVSLKISNFLHSISKNDPLVNVEQWSVENYDSEEVTRTVREKALIDKLRSLWGR